MAKADHTWGDNVGSESRKSFGRWLQDGFYEKYLAGDHVLDIGFKGYVDGVRPITPNAIGVDVDYPGYDGRTLPFPDESQDAIFNSHTLEHIEDYRSAIRDWYRVLKVGGHLVITVPHWCLYERKGTMPPYHNMDHKRYYTAASLLAEIEDALDPFSFRVRIVEDNDRGFDYTILPGQHAVGSYELICVIEKIKRPAYADQVLNERKVQRDQVLKEQNAHKDQIPNEQKWRIPTLRGVVRRAKRVLQGARHQGPPSVSR